VTYCFFIAGYSTLLAEIFLKKPSFRSCSPTMKQVIDPSQALDRVGFPLFWFKFIHHIPC